jgi:hypothetical protein
MHLYFVYSLLALIAFQDFKERQVYWFLFPILFLLGFIEKPLSDTFIQVALNLLFLSFIFLLLLIYFLCIRQRPLQFLHSQMGLGDIFFFIALSSFFPFPDYALFFCISLILALLLSAPFFILNSITIPLAGLQAVCLAIILVLRLKQVPVFTIIKSLLF